MTSIAKISVVTFCGKEQILYDFDKSASLFDNINNVCKKTGLPTSQVYGFKHHPTKNNLANNYVSEENYQEIKHNDCLKIVFSVKYIINFIDQNITEPNMRPEVFGYIEKLNTDPVFIKELALSEVYHQIVDIFILAELELKEEKSLLITVLHLFSKGYITDTNQDVLQKVLNILSNTDKGEDHYKYSLSILQKILVSKNTVFDHWKEKIIKSLLLKDIMAYIWTMSNKDLHYSAILLINTLIRVCKNERKLKLIKEMNQSKNRENIYIHVIVKENLEKNMEHELYVLQTYLLSLFTEAYTSEISVNDTKLFKREDFELCSEDLRRITILMDFEDDSFGNQLFSLENLILNDGDRDSRISLASMQSDLSFRTSSKRSSCRGYTENYDAENPTISHLTLEALRYYKTQHYRNFHQSQIEEKLYEPGIYITSERIVKMIGRLLHIGVQAPDNKSTFYQPIVFFSSRKTPFFFELFSRSMWLLSQTRRDMKACSIPDYPKVMYILEKQIKMALETKPLNFTSLTDAMSNTSFNKVLEQIQKKKEHELKRVINTHPCIQEMKTDFIKENEKLIYQQRISCLQQGSHFPKVLEKKTTGNIFVQLSRNEQDLLVHEVENVKNPSCKSAPETFKIADITHIVIGNNCQHSNLCNPKLAFSIVINHEEKVKFIGKDEKLAAYWTDAFILLTNNEKSSQLSTYYNTELDELVSMDIRLSLLELQNINIPSHPPPVPAPPAANVKPTLPPRPARLSSRRGF